MLESRETPAPNELNVNSSHEQQIESLKNSVSVEAVGAGKVRRYFLCVAKAFTLQPDDANMNALCRSFYNMTVLGRHFMTVYMLELLDS